MLKKTTLAFMVLVTAGVASAKAIDFQINTYSASTGNVPGVYVFVNLGDDQNTFAGGGGALTDQWGTAHINPVVRPGATITSYTVFVNDLILAGPNYKPNIPIFWYTYNTDGYDGTFFQEYDLDYFIVIAD
jgi:hypothetical protein